MSARTSARCFRESTVDKLSLPRSRSLSAHASERAAAASSNAPTSRSTVPSVCLADITVNSRPLFRLGESFFSRAVPAAMTALSSRIAGAASPVASTRIVTS
eukprot:Amastigsp_a177064_33.p8 type:complete len:102 gc:universal Amastigsp_a177064_33:854-1159(+)